MDKLTVPKKRYNKFKRDLIKEEWVFMNGLASSIHADIAKIVGIACFRKMITFFMLCRLFGFELLEKYGVGLLS